MKAEDVRLDFSLDEQKQRLINPIETPQVTQDLSNNVVLTTLNDLYNWARMSSLWPMLYGTSCCFIEFAAMIGSRFDFDRFGLQSKRSLSLPLLRQWLQEQYPARAEPKPLG